MDFDGFGRGEEIKPCRLCQVWEKKGNHIEFDRFKGSSKKDSDTQGCARTVPQFCTDRALRRLATEFG